MRKALINILIGLAANILSALVLHGMHVDRRPNQPQPRMIYAHHLQEGPDTGTASAAAACA